VQQLYDVPVIADSSYSFLNLKDEWFVNNQLVNTGKGINYGIDLTFERFMSQGYYFMFTASLFNSDIKAEITFGAIQDLTVIICSTF